MDKEKIIKFLENGTIADKRPNGEVFYKFNEETEFKEHWEKIKDILFNSGFEIKDFYYNTLDSAFNDLADYYKYNELGEDVDLDELEIEADIYTRDLINWLNEDLNNIYLVDDALKELGNNNLIGAMQYAQVQEKENVYLMALEIVNYLKGVDENA